MSLRETDMKVWTGIRWLNTGYNGGSLCTLWWTLR